MQTVQSAKFTKEGRVVFSKKLSSVLKSAINAHETLPNNPTRAQKRLLSRLAVINYLLKLY